MSLVNSKKIRTIFFPFFIVFLVFLYAYAPRTAEAASDGMAESYFQCSRHGHNDYKDCGGVWDYFPRSDYFAAATSFQFLGHRHGGSSITANVCLTGTNGEGQCQWFQCSGDSCGFEYGGDHPFNLLDGGSFTVNASGSGSGFAMFRSAAVMDAEVRVSASAAAYYDDYGYEYEYEYQYQTPYNYSQGYYYGQGYYEGAYEGGYYSYQYQTPAYSYQYQTPGYSYQYQTPGYSYQYQTPSYSQGYYYGQGSYYGSEYGYQYQYEYEYQTPSINFSVTYAEQLGTLNVTCNNPPGGSWTITGPDPDSPMSRVGPSSSDSVRVGTYTVTFAAVTGYLTPAPQSPTVSNGATTNVACNYALNPLEAPVITTIDNSTCRQIRLVWTDNSDNEKTFRIYRDGVQAGEVGLGVTTFTDTPPNPNVSYAYTVRSWTDIPVPPGSRESSDSNTESALNRPCEPNLSNSSKTLTSPAPNDLKEGVTATFLITISNAAVATAAADITRIDDQITTNLKNFRVASVSGLTCGNPCISGNSPNYTINVTGRINPGQNATVQLQAEVDTLDQQDFETIKNTATIYYTGVGIGAPTGSITAVAGPFLTKTGKPRIPNFREVAP